MKRFGSYLAVALGVATVAIEGGVSRATDFAFPDPTSFQTTVLNAIGPYWIAGIVVGLSITGVLILLGSIARRKRLGSH